MLARLEDGGMIEIASDRHVRLCAGGRPAAAAKAAVEAQDARRAYERSRLEMMRSYIDLTACRRGFVLNYFGEEFAPPCGACDACDAGVLAAPAGASPFGVGERVQHDTFGSGSVHRVEPERIIVLFDDAGYTTLDATLAVEGGLLRPAGPPTAAGYTG
jgi:ATP-dependent DNA helicase RecQ